MTWQFLAVYAKKTNQIKLLQKPAISLQIGVLLQYFLYKTLQFLYNTRLRAIVLLLRSLFRFDPCS